MLGACLIAATPCDAGDVKPWQLRLEGAAAEIHRESGDGAAAALRLARVSRTDVLRLEAGLVLGNADEGFGVLDLGVEVRLCSARCRVAPYLGGGMGFMTEPEFSGAVFRAGGGIEVAIGADNSVRVGVQRATHGGESGPHLIWVGFAHRWGSRR